MKYMGRYFGFGAGRYFVLFRATRLINNWNYQERLQFEFLWFWLQILTKD